MLLVMLTLAIYYSVALKLFGLDLALPIGVFTGLAVFVPYLGFGLGLVLATLAGASSTGILPVLESRRRARGGFASADVAEPDLLATAVLVGLAVLLLGLATAAFRARDYAAPLWVRHARARPARRRPS